MRCAKLRNAEFESVADVHALEKIRITQRRGPRRDSLQKTAKDSSLRLPAHAGSK
jgi:hypothetical protein